MLWSESALCNVTPRGKDTAMTVTYGLQKVTGNLRLCASFICFRAFAFSSIKKLKVAKKGFGFWFFGGFLDMDLQLVFEFLHKTLLPTTCQTSGDKRLLKGTNIKHVCFESFD